MFKQHYCVIRLNNEGHIFFGSKSFKMISVKKGCLAKNINNIFKTKAMISSSNDKFYLSAGELRIIILLIFFSIHLKLSSY